MSSNFYEENHFVRGDRKINLTDIGLARLYGPILKQLILRKQPMPFTEFVRIAKSSYPKKNAALLYASPRDIGRRFECFRLYLKFYHLPDLSAWVTALNGENSEV